MVTIALATWLASQTERKFTYRIAFIPETIGSLVYCSRNIEAMQQNILAGFNVTCIGDERCYSFLPSRGGETYADVVAKHVLKYTDAEYMTYSWLDRGSDERQYCAPGIDLPVTTIMRSKYDEYPEYHTSLDDLQNVVTPNGLEGGFTALQRALEVIENDFTPQVTCLGEPQLGKRGLYPDISIKGSATDVRMMMNMISCCDGTASLLQIAEKIDAPFWMLTEAMKPLLAEGLIVPQSE